MTRRRVPATAMRTVRHLLPAALAAALLAGCGGGSEPSDADQVRDTITAYLDAQTSGDGTAACALLRPAGRRQLAGLVAKAAEGLITQPSCEDAVGLVRTAAGPDLLRQLADAQVEDVQVTGSRATAVVAGGSEIGRRTVTLVRVGGEWRIDAVAGLAG